MNTNRRNFIRSTSLATASLGLAGPFSQSVFAGTPSDQLNVALIGVRNMGFGILERHLEKGNVNCVGLCDVDGNLLEKRASDVQKSFGQKPVLYKDFRKLLENKDIDDRNCGLSRPLALFAHCLCLSGRQRCLR